MELEIPLLLSVTSDFVFGSSPPVARLISATG